MTKQKGTYLGRFKRKGYVYLSWIYINTKSDQYGQYNSPAEAPGGGLLNPDPIKLVFSELKMRGLHLTYRIMSWVAI